jgi:hypothetical protein
MIIVDSPITGKRESLTQSQFNSYMAQTNGAVLKWIVASDSVTKHGEHDQKTHGSWATGSVPTSITTTTNAIGQEVQTIKYGDIVIERDKPTGVRDSSDLTRYMWTFTAGSDAMRTVSSQIMRTPNPSNQMQLNEDTKNTILEGVERPNPNTSDNFAVGDYARQYISGAYTLLEDVRTSKPLSEPLFRGLMVPNSSSLLQLKVGETFALPLSSVTNSQNVAERYSWRFGSNRIAQASIVFKFENTRATQIRHQSSEGGTRLISEYVTQGKYKVESISRGTDVKNDDYTLVTLSQTDVFNIERGNYEPTTP